MPKVPLEIKGFGGINKLHTRSLGQPSDGKNFWTRSGSLYTREGCSVVADTPFAASIASLHTVAKVGLDNSIFLAEEGTNLWHSRDGLSTWASIKGDVTGNNYSTCIWGTPYGDYYLLLVSGTQQLVYDITAGTLAAMVNEDGDVPSFEFVTTFRGYVWGWGPNYADSNLIRFCGYDDNDDVSIDWWPLDYAINPSGNPGEPVLAAHPINEELFVLTDKGSYHIYGFSEDNFESAFAGNIGVYKARCSARVGDYVLWLDRDKKVQAYSGTNAYAISQPIDEYLADEDFTGVYAVGMGKRFWLIFPGSATTKAYVFDVEEKGWYIHEFPGVFTAGVYHGEYLSDMLAYYGMDDGRLVKLDPDKETDFNTAIVTGFTIGPINIKSRKLKGKILHLTAEPKNDFSLDVYSQTDQNDEVGPETVDFETGDQVDVDVKIKAKKGKNLSVRIETTDKINELQSATLTVRPGRQK